MLFILFFLTAAICSRKCAGGYCQRPNTCYCSGGQVSVSGCSGSGGGGFNGAGSGFPGGGFGPSEGM